jgi:hypothetical protein
MIVEPSAGRRRVMAIPRASVTSAVRMLSSIDHPTIRREYASRTAAQ